MIDDRGIGAITYTLANPNGIDEAIHDAGNGEYYIDSPDGLWEIMLLSGSDDTQHAFDERGIVDRTQTTDTELHAVMYFVPTQAFELNEGIRLVLCRSLPEENIQEEQSIIFTLDSFVPSAELRSPEGYTAYISPMGIFFDAHFEGIDPFASLKELSVQFADGTEYVLASQEPYMSNYVVAFGSFENNIEAVAFNRLVDTAEVTSVTRNGPNGTTCVFTPVR